MSRSPVKTMVISQRSNSTRRPTLEETLATSAETEIPVVSTSLLVMVSSVVWIFLVQPVLVTLSVVLFQVWASCCLIAKCCPGVVNAVFTLQLSSVPDLQEKLVEAAELCGAVLREAPRNARAFYIRAAVLRKEGKRTEATEAACEAARLRPDRPSVVLAAGSLLCREKCFARALALYTRALKEDPGNAQYHLGGEAGHLFFLDCTGCDGEEVPREELIGLPSSHKNRSPAPRGRARLEAMFAAAEVQRQRPSSRGSPRS